MNEIKIITELHPEDRYRLDLIIQLLGQSLKPEDAQACVKAAAEQHPVDNPYPDAPATADEQKAAAADTTPPWEEKPAESPTEAKKAAQFKKSDVQAAIVRLVAAGKKSEARDIVKAYAASVSALPEDVIDEVVQKLKKLEG